MSPHTNRYVVFRLAGEDYAVPVSRVSTVIRYEQATPVPRAPSSVLGVINLRGRVVPVVDLKKRFRGAEFEPGTYSRIIVAEGSAGPVGLVVDEAREVASFDPDTILPVPDGVLSGDTARAFSGVIERDGTLVILLDLNEAVPCAEYATARDDARTEGENDG